jgi:hypothetical protein
VVQIRDDSRELLLGLLVEVGHGDACSENGVVGVGGCHVCSSLGSQVIQLDCVDALVDTGNDLHGNSSSVDMVGVEAVTQPRDTSCDLVELDTLLASV